MPEKSKPAKLKHSERAVGISPINITMGLLLLVLIVCGILLYWSYPSK